MVTRTQKIDFIYHNFTRKGKRITKKELNDYRDAEIDYIINTYSNEDEVLKWVNRPKAIKYFVEATKDGKPLTFEVKATDENNLRKLFQKENMDIEKYVVAKGHHICKYCGGIADGTTKDVLCGDCRETFGHYLYSEL